VVVGSWRRSHGSGSSNAANVRASGCSETGELLIGREGSLRNRYEKVPMLEETECRPRLYDLPEISWLGDPRTSIARQRHRPIAPPQGLRQAEVWSLPHLVSVRPRNSHEEVHQQHDEHGHLDCEEGFKEAVLGVGARQVVNVQDEHRDECHQWDEFHSSEGKDTGYSDHVRDNQLIPHFVNGSSVHPRSSADGGAFSIPDSRRIHNGCREPCGSGRHQGLTPPASPLRLAMPAAPQSSVEGVLVRS